MSPAKPTKTGGIYGARYSDSPREKLLHAVRRLLRRSNSRALGLLTRQIDTVGSWFRPKYLPLPMRALISVCQPIDPLKRNRNLPAIELVIPFVEKDLAALPAVLANAKKHVRNPIGLVTLITPRNAEGTGPRFSNPQSSLILEEILFNNADARLRFDQDLLGPQILEHLNQRFGAGDRNAGWVNQQLIKLSAVMDSEYPGALILDSDTILLSPKTWLRSDGTQLLQVANEYHVDFMRHVEKFFGVPKRYRLSFVTHHQLMQPEVVRRMFPQGAQSLIEWWESSTDSMGRDLGDYEAYGSFLAHHYPKRVAYGSFSNLFSPAWEQFSYDLEHTGAEPEDLVPDYCSISFHSWAQVPRKS